MIKYNLLRHLCSLLFLLIMVSSCNGQDKTQLQGANASDPYFVDSQDTIATHGPRNITRNLLEDKNGNIWFATWEGIIRYDGKLFTNFTLKEGLIKFHVFSVLEDKTGNIWFGTIRGGLYRYNPSSDKAGVESFTLFTTKDGIANNMILCMLEDKSGNIWFGTDDGVSCYNGKTFTNFNTKDGLSGNSVNSIEQDKTGTLWFGTRYGENGDVSCFDGKSFTNFKNKEGLTLSNVRSILEDKTGNIWIGGQDGLYRYNLSAEKAGGKSMTNFSMNFIGYLFEDKKGNLWISSGEKNARNMVLSFYDKKSLSLPYGLANSSQIIKKGEGQIFGITEDKYGNIWFGTENGACRYNPSADKASGKSFTTFND